jgi:hypothetical protein
MELRSESAPLMQIANVVKKYVHLDQDPRNVYFQAVLFIIVQHQFGCCTHQSYRVSNYLQSYVHVCMMCKKEV